MNSPKKIVLLQLISNGDCLYATAVARQIKYDYPGCLLTWVIAASSKSMIDNNPFVDEARVIPDVSKANCVSIIRHLKKELQTQKKQGLIDEVFFTQVIDDNLANYDGTIRSAIFRGYGKPVTVPFTPVLRLYDVEKEDVNRFAEKHKLAGFRNVILFEFAPQSGQLAMTPDLAIDLAKEIVAIPGTAVILSSNIKIGDNIPGIIDGSTLSIRQTAALTHFCTLLLGCSSGITWVSTSEAAKPLPMIQVLDPDAFWVNPISRDFQRCGYPTDQLVELYEFNRNKIIDCIHIAIHSGMAAAKIKYDSPLPLQFKTTSRSIYNMLCFLQFNAIARHIRINMHTFGWNPLLIREIGAGFITAPFKLAKNIFNKKIRRKGT